MHNSPIVFAFNVFFQVSVSLDKWVFESGKMNRRRCTASINIKITAAKRSVQRISDVIPTRTNTKSEVSMKKASMDAHEPIQHQLAMIREYDMKNPFVGVII